MIKDILFQIKYIFSRITFSSKKETDKRLKESFGKYKDGSFNFDAIEKYFRNKANTEVHQVLSDKTCNDLDFDDLFMSIDRTNSRVGQQYLYNKLRTINLDKAQTKLDEEIIEALSEDTELRISIQKRLKKLESKDAYYITTLFQDRHIEPPKWFGFIKTLSFLSLTALVFSFFEPLFIVVLVGLFFFNFVIHYWNKNNLDQYVNSIPQLLRLSTVASYLGVHPMLKKLNPNLSTSIKLINEVKNRMSFFQLETKLQGEFEILVWFLFEIFKIIFLLEPLLLFGILKRLDTKRKEVEDVFKFVGHIDMLISTGSLRDGLNVYCIPSINENTNRIIVKEVYHPLIFNCKNNDVEILNKSILLTGSNMSGKTSFIRAIGLNVITGLTINTCFAKSLSFPLLRIFSAIRINDDLMNDKSYYFEEVLTIKEMIQESEGKSNSLFLLDEIFKGTNTVERISAGKAVLSTLAKNNNIVLVSTHDIELADMLSSEYELYHFSEVLSDNTIDFDYKLKQGKLKNRNAIRILALNDYPSEVVQEAIRVSSELDKTYLASKTKQEK